MPIVWEAKTLADSFVSDQKEKHLDPDAYRGYKFPMDWWMDKTGGIQKSWLSFIYGKAGIGKTSVLTTAAVQFGKDKVPFAYFAMEENVFTTAQRVFANLADINRTKFRDIKLSQTDFQNLYVACNEFGLFDAYFIDDAWSDVEITAALESINAHRKQNSLKDLEVVIVDYLQLMDMAGAGNQSNNVSKASKYLLKIAKGKIPIVMQEVDDFDQNGRPIKKQVQASKPKAVMASAQLNDDGNVLWSRDPDRDADLIVEISGVDDGFGQILPDKRNLRIRKFRHGDVASTKCQFIGGRSLIGQMLSPAAAAKMQPPMP